MNDIQYINEEDNFIDKIRNKEDLTNIEFINKIIRDIRFGKEANAESNSKKLLKRILSLFPGIGIVNLSAILSIVVDLYLKVLPDDKSSELEDLIYDFDIKLKTIDEKIEKEPDAKIIEQYKDMKKTLNKEKEKISRKMNKALDKASDKLDKLTEKSEYTTNSSRLNPVFIINSYTNTLMGNVIKSFTGDAYTHSAICFSSKLDKMYSYNGSGVSMNKKGGLSCESIEDYIDTWRDAQIQVSVVFFKEKEYRILKERMDYYLANYKNTSYDFKNVFNVVFNKVMDSKDALSMVCSQFVDNLLKFVNADITGKSSNLVTPGNMSNVYNPKVYVIFEGRAKNYDADKAGKIVRRLSRNVNNAIVEQAVINEAMEFPVQFDEEGNLLIARRDKVDFLDEYNKSKKLREGYIKYNNLEGLKYESAKLWYLNTIILKKLDGNISEEEKDELIKVRSKILTEFSLYINAIMKMDKKFNFGYYYESTPFNDAKIKINGSTIKYSAKLLSELVKSMIQ